MSYIFLTVFSPAEHLNQSMKDKTIKSCYSYFVPNVAQGGVPDGTFSKVVC